MCNLMSKNLECENCGKKFTTEKRKNNHFKICNYENLEKEITNLKFEIFSLKSINHNNIKDHNLLYNSYQNDMNTIYYLCDNLDNVNIKK